MVLSLLRFACCGHGCEYRKKFPRDDGFLVPPRFRFQYIARERHFFLKHFGASASASRRTLLFSAANASDSFAMSFSPENRGSSQSFSGTLFAKNFELNTRESGIGG